MAKRKREGADSIYEVADLWRRRCLAERRSLFDPEASIWRTEYFSELDEKFIGRPDEGGRSFMDKLDDQLQGASPGATQLMAELLYVHFLVTVTIGGAKKREIIDHVLSTMASPPEVPRDLAEACNHGLVNPGTFFMTRRDRALAFLIRFGTAWSALDDDERSCLLGDPWAFAEMVYAIEVDSAFAQRNALLHLAFPDSFEAVVSDAHKAQIVDRFSEFVSSPSLSLDQQLLQVREALEPDATGELDFYSDETKPRWFGPPGDWSPFVSWAARFYEMDDFDDAERTYKLEIVERLSDARAALADGRDDWMELLKRGLQKDNNLTAWQVHGKFLDWCAGHPEEASAALGAIWAPGEAAPERVAAFLERVPDSVISGTGTRLSLASLLLMSTDPTEFTIYRSQPFERAYDLLGMTKPSPKLDELGVYHASLVLLDQLIDEASARDLELRDRLDAQSLLWMVTKWDPPGSWSTEDRRAFLKWRGESEPEPMAVPDGSGGPGEATLEALAASLYLPEDYLERTVKLLTEKGQVIFHGPPGTGKTYVARKLANHLAGEDGRVELVQFHPSYAYEDFVEGFRPNADGAFELRSGPLLRMAREATANPNSTYVLVIDELNRGNLAKVLGELYFLLEYRSSEISLQYSDEPFRMPKNLLVIGTMNTADRSIALVDGALRRRFYFVPFFPDAEPVAGLLRRWLANGREDMAWVADVVDEANQRLGNRHVAIGPSHFMRDDLDEEWLDLIWEHSVLPYVEEQLFGGQQRLTEFTLEALRERGGSEASDIGDPGDFDEDTRSD